MSWKSTFLSCEVGGPAHLLLCDPRWPFHHHVSIPGSIQESKIKISSPKDVSRKLYTLPSIG